MLRRAGVLLLICVLLAACGGSGDDDDDDGSTSSGGGGGAGAAAAAATTPTPDTSSTAPAGATTAAAPAATFALMPDPATASGLRAIVDSEFDDPLKAPFIAESLGNGTETKVENDEYSVTPADGQLQIMLPKAIPAVADGIVETEVSISGDGAGGVAVRVRKTPQNTLVGYVCWVALPDRAGCSFSDKNVFENLFTAAPGMVQIGETNLVRAAMIGDQLQLEVNGVVVGRATDTRNVNGNWGVYAESFAGATATSIFEWIRIYRVIGSYDLP